MPEISMKIPTYLIPHCANCNRPMSMNLRANNTFVQDEGWYKAHERYQKYLQKYSEKKIIFMDLGIGFNTPGIIKIPFWQMTQNNPNSIYICINRYEVTCSKVIEERSILISGDIKDIIEELIKR